MRRAAVALLLATVTSAGAASAQEPRTSLPYGSERPTVVSVTPGERYVAGALHQAAFGRRYRDLWSTPVQVPVLDLAHFAGGLEPKERGGGMQTRSLHFEAGDGREFTFRSLDKDPTEAVPEPLRNTVVHRLVQDATSAMNPGGPLVAPVLLEAVGVLHAPPTLVVLPDDPRLGEHREEFAGLLGMIEERPDEGFGGAAEIIDSEDLGEKLRESPEHRVDAANFLAARLVDHLLGDWDRHSDQWRWAGFPRAGGGTVWRPLPRDRDQALVRYDGFVTGVARTVNPKLVTFGPALPGNLAGFTWNGRELDRAFLAPLDAAAFDSVASAVQAALTDDVIETAVRRLPAAHYERWGAWTAQALRRRRDALDEHARRYYRYLATDVEVWGTEADDLAEARWEDDTLHLRIRGAKAPGAWYERSFIRRETAEVRLHLREGTDGVVVTGNGNGPRLRIIREPSDTVVGADRNGRVVLEEYLPEPDREDSSSASAVPEVPRDWGAATSAGPSAGYDPDLGLLLGAQAVWTDFAFRHAPYRSRIRVAAVYATAADGLRLEATTDFRRVDPRTRLGLLVRASEIEVVRFTGYGNETPPPTSAADVAHWQLTVAPTIERDLSPSLRARVGPLLRYGTTDRDAGTVVRDTRPLGAAGFGRLGAIGDLEVETPALRITAGAGAYAPLHGGSGGFGDFHGDARLAVPLGSPTLAARIGARRLWGDFPYDEAAFLGGARTLRGYEYQRFAGDGMVYGGVELRLPVARLFPRDIPTRLGLIGLADWGRVWSPGRRSERMHAAAGGGIWLEFFESRYAASLVHARGREGGQWYLQLGLPY